MPLNLLCTALHPMIPSLSPADVVALTIAGDTLTVTLTGSAAGVALRRLAQAVQDRALVLQPGAPFDEIERDVLARFEATVAGIDARLADAQALHRQVSAA